MEARLAALVRRDSSLQVQQAGHGEAGECIDPSSLFAATQSLVESIGENFGVRGENLGEISVVLRISVPAKICNLDQISVVISVKISL